MDFDIRFVKVLLLTCLGGCYLMLHAQAPQNLSYQSVIRDASNNLVVNSMVGVQISILQGAADGPSVYTETHSVSSNANGLISLFVGDGTIVSGVMANIDWSEGPYFIQSEVDPLGGSNYTITGVTPLLSVPYALYASNGLNAGDMTGELLYWDGSTWAQLAPSPDNYVLTICNGVPTWTPNGYCIGSISSIECSSVEHLGHLMEGFETLAATSTISYIGSNGGYYDGISVTSTGVEGLTLSLPSGVFVSGNGELEFQIMGTPDSYGTATWAFTLAGVSCTLEREVLISNGWGPESNHVHCGEPTQVVEVLNPVTGRIWMDRNLGASIVAQSSTDEEAFGDLYQWGRFADGHQCRYSAVTEISNFSNHPDHGDFIYDISAGGGLFWGNPCDDEIIWQRLDSDIFNNNPCPSGFSVPTWLELYEESQSWISNDAAGAFASPLKLPMAGYRYYSSGVDGSGELGRYWTNTSFQEEIPFYAKSGSISTLDIDSQSISHGSLFRTYGASVRCIKDALPIFSGAIELLDCEDVVLSDALVSGLDASGVTVTVPYSSGNGGNYPPFTANSTGDVAGLTLTMNGGLFNNGNGALIINLSGTPIGSGNAVFDLNIGGQTCSLNIPVAPWYPNYSTQVVDVINPATGKTWMDRNLGASRVALHSEDRGAYGDLFQWGRGSDGHQCRDSPTRGTLSSTDQPVHGDFILAPNFFDWRDPLNDNLWQGINGVNNPCPSGYRLPTETELNAERTSWSSNDVYGAFNSPLKLSLSGTRNNNGSLVSVGSDGRYWSSTFGGADSRWLIFGFIYAEVNSNPRAYGFSVRCIKD